MMSRIVALLAILPVTVVITGMAAHASSGGCQTDVGWDVAQAVCETSKEGWQDMQDTAGAQSYQYELERACGSENVGDVCSNPRNCDSDPPLGLYNIYRAGVGQDDWTLVATVCLDPEDGDEGPGPKDVQAEFERLTWPQASLVIQPPQGETLVNFDTIFYTTSTEPVSQSVQLLGAQVEIVATPSAYTWHWDQAEHATVAADAEPFVTSDHGAPYPDQTITWQYTDAHDGAPEHRCHLHRALPHQRQAVEGPRCDAHGDRDARPGARRPGGEAHAGEVTPPGLRRERVTRRRRRRC